MALTYDIEIANVKWIVLRMPSADTRSCNQPILKAAIFRGLRALQRAEKRRFESGVVLYDGETCAPFGDRLFAVPIRVLWEYAAAPPVGCPT